MGDVPPDPSQTPRDRPVEEKSASRQKSGSARNQFSLETDPQRSTQPTHQMLRPAGVEYYPNPHGYMPASSHGTRRTPLNMADMSSTLPAYQSPSMSFSQQALHQQYIPVHHSQSLMYPVQQLPFPGQGPGGSAVYNMPYPATFQDPYAHYHQNSHLQHGTPGYQPYLQNQSSHQGSLAVSGQSPLYPAYYAQHPYTPAYSPSQPMQGLGMRDKAGVEYYNLQAPTTSAQGFPRKEGERREPAHLYDVSQTIVDGSSPLKASRVHPHAPGPSETNPQRTSVSALPNTPRGPPRKPKQSGHALWVGNLPPGANVVDLKDHFSRDATQDIESVFLISKSNCAFVNYKSETACVAAMARFHDSRFQGVRLVCRLRKGLTVPGPGNNPGAALTASLSRFEDETRSPLSEEGGGKKSKSKRADDSTANALQSLSKIPERFFIVKSLTVEDLELSRRSGIWATQTHNEDTLNRAYKSTDNVYLIFSANKSGEYFGYARMISPIGDDETLALEMLPRPENLPADAEDFNVTPTEATATAPRGHIIDDSARGTIFWEANSPEEEGNDDTDDNNDNDDDEDENNDDDDMKSERSVEETIEENAGLGPQAFGNPFRIEWMSTERVPFYRSRGLRNPWNANREVKIARDGTEIEPSVGRKLTQLFHAQLTGQVTPSSRQPQGYPPPSQQPSSDR